jgi:hypothetical protein
VRPDLIYLIIYPGGYGGEFMAYWLSRHPGCVKSRVIPLKNNRYVWLFDHEIELDPASTCKDRLFLITHPDSGTRSFNGVPGDQLNRCYLSCKNPAYRKFFFLLSWLKQRLFKFPIITEFDELCSESEGWRYHPMRQFTDDRPLNEFQAYIQYREWFYQCELDSFKNRQPNLDMLSRARAEYQYSGIPQYEYTNLFTIHIDQLMFDGDQSEHKRMCEHFGIDYESAHEMMTAMYLYHQRNLAVYRRYVDVPIDDFIDMSYEQAWPLVEQAVLRRHNES